jgi:RHS repeat-associated protein
VGCRLDRQPTGAVIKLADLALRSSVVGFEHVHGRALRRGEMSMLSVTTRGWSSAVREVVVGLLLPLQLVAAMPVSAQPVAQSAWGESSLPATPELSPEPTPEPSPEPTAQPTPAPSAPPVQANHTLPPTEPMPAFPIFSAPATTTELVEARVFGEPLLPLGDPTPAENQALAQAVLAYLHGTDHENTEALDSFLAAFSNTAWRASLLANMGATLHRRWAVTRAQDLLEQAWTLAKDDPHPNARAIAALALAELLAMHMTFGHQQALEDLLAQARGREWSGMASTMVTEAGLAVVGLHEEHHHALPSGPIALGELLRHLELGSFAHPKLQEFHATPNGATLLEIKDLGARAGLHLRMVANQRALAEPDTAADARPRQSAASKTFDVPIPSIVHLRAKHFAAVVGRSGDRYLLSDPLLGGEVWISASTLAAESTGFFLVLAGGDAAANKARSKHGADAVAFASARMPQGWREASNDEAVHVRGKCKFASVEVEATTGGEPTTKTCPNGDCPKGLADYTFLTAQGALRIADTPLGYAPAFGTSIDFTPVYNQNEAGQPATFTFSNLGPRWSFSWLSWIQDDPTDPTSQARVFRRGGGQEVAKGFNSLTASYAPDTRTRAVLVRTSTSPIRYERRLADGSIDVYAEPDGAAVSPRRVFLTESRDPQGNTTTFHYAKGPKLIAVQDALGQVTSLYYDSHSDKYKVTRVVDPFGRETRLEYRPTSDGTNQLVKIVDVIGMESSFEYGADNFITAMTTPYGTTTFRWSKDAPLNHVVSRWIEATDPLGGTERLEYRFSVDPAAVPASDPAAKVPTGFSYNQALNLRNSFYWDKRAWAQHPGDYTKARLTHWLWSATLTIAPVPASTKEPLEGRVWHEHEGSSMLGGISPIGRPARIGRVLDNGTSQVTRYEYNSKGRVTRVTDPVGRATVYEYAANEIDLEHVRQVTGATTTELLATMAYGAAAPHVPSSVTDSAGQVTTMTYDTRGRVATVVTPPRNGPNGTPLSAAERTTTHAYFPDNAASGPGRLQTITGPSTPQGSPVTSFTYDGYGRVRTTTEPDGYTLTLDYDALDRPTRTTFPDGTTTETRYNRLDADGSKDRLNRWTTTFHDALGRATAQRDPAGRMTRLEWCTCGSLDKLIDANGQATTWERDVQGRVTREVRPDNAAWQYAYEPATGRLLTRTDPKGQVTTYAYFTDDNLTSMTYSNASVATATVSYTYDPLYDRVATMTDGIGTTTHAYHPITTTPALGAGQLASVSGPLTTSTVSYTYDELRRVASHGLSGAVSAWKYDALGRPATLTHPVGTFTYSYDGVTGRPLTLTYPNNQSTAYAYLGHTGDHRLQEIKHLAPGGTVLSKFNYGYDPTGNIKTWTQQYAPDPAKAYSFGYDRADQLTAATLRSTDPTPVLLKRYGYAYDPAGNRTAEQVDNTGTSASYNARNELLSRQAGGMMFFRGALTEPGTVTVNGTPATVTPPPDNAFEAQVPLVAGTNNITVVAKDASGNQRTSTYQVTSTGPTTTTYTHDANGNLTGDGVKTYEWDAENRLVRVCTGACVGNGSTDIARYAYDGQGRRVRKIVGTTILEYVYDSAEIAEERSSSGTNLRFVHGPGIDQHWAQYVSTTPSSPTYPLADHLGSIVQQANTAGAVTFTRQYDPWGNLLVGGTAGRYAYTGREWDTETGLYYYRARYYDAKVGRFISEDPLDLIARQREWNAYAYVRNRPIVLLDPSGLVGDLPGYIHSSIPQLTANDGRVRPGETQGSAILAKETDTACFYVTGSLTRFAGAVIGLTKSRIKLACKMKCEINCPKIQTFFESRGADAVVVGRVNVYCDQVPRYYEEWRKYE